MTSESALVTLALGGVVGYLVGYFSAWRTARKLEAMNLKPSEWDAADWSRR